MFRRAVPLASAMRILLALVTLALAVPAQAQLIIAHRGASGERPEHTPAAYERAIDAHVKNLRKKIEPTPGRPRYLLTVHGVGYRFADA